MVKPLSRSIRPLKILGSTVNMVDMPYIMDWLETAIRDYRQRESSGLPVAAKHLMVAGYHGVIQAKKDKHYYEIGEAADLWIPDSIGPVLVARLRGMKDAVTTPGPDMMAEFLEIGSRRHYRSFFYGETPETLAALQAAVARDYPGHIIAGAFSPPFRPMSAEEEAEHVAMINAARPDILWVGLGLPKQDEWIYRNISRLKVPVATGVGAAFGFLSGRVGRAPGWCRKLGLEWLYMLLRKPRRTCRRVFIDGSEFVLAVIREEIHLRRESHRGGD